MNHKTYFILNSTAENQCGHLLQCWISTEDSGGVPNWPVGLELFVVVEEKDKEEKDYLLTKKGQWMVI